MNKPTPSPASFSKISVKSQTILPHAVRQRPGVKAGDTLRYRLTEDGVLIDKAPPDMDDPRATFSEWGSEADEKAYAKL